MRYNDLEKKHIRTVKELENRIISLSYKDPKNSGPGLVSKMIPVTYCLEEEPLSNNSEKGRVKFSYDGVDIEVTTEKFDDHWCKCEVKFKMLFLGKEEDISFKCMLPSIETDLEAKGCVINKSRLRYIVEFYLKFGYCPIEEKDKR